jgi:hypothetical protein
VSVTFEVGQMLFQHNNGRIWRIQAPASPRLDSRRWQLILVTRGTRDERELGEVTISSESWILANCEDYPAKVDAPIGDGEQCVWIRLDDGMVFDEATFSTTTDAVAYIEEHLADDRHAEWFGWLPQDPGETPDLIAVLIGTEVRWMEPSTPMS